MEADNEEEAIARFGCTRYSQHGIPYRGTMVVYHDRLEFSGRAIILISTHEDCVYFHNVISIKKASFLGIPTLISVVSMEDGAEKSRHYGSFMLRRSCAVAALVHFWLAVRRPPAFLFDSSVRRGDTHTAAHGFSLSAATASVADAARGAREALFGGAKKGASSSSSSWSSSSSSSFSGRGGGSGGGGTEGDDLEATRRAVLLRQDESRASVKRSVATARRAQASGAATLAALDEQGEQLRRINASLDAMSGDLDIGDRALKDMERPFLVGAVMPLSRHGPTSGQIARERADEARAAGRDDPTAAAVSLTGHSGLCQVPALQFDASTMRGNVYTPLGLEFADGSPGIGICTYEHAGGVDDDAVLQHTDTVQLDSISHIIVGRVPYSLVIKRFGDAPDLAVVSAYRQGLLEEIIWRSKGKPPAVVFEEGARDLEFKEKDGLRVLNRQHTRPSNAATRSRPQEQGAGASKKKGGAGGGGGGGGSGGSGGKGGGRRSDASDGRGDHLGSDDSLFREKVASKNADIDTSLDELDDVAKVLNAMAHTMGHHLNEQSAMIDDLDGKVDRNAGRIKDQTKRAAKIT